jgi:N-acetylmuramic acid 6-phosphate etherase
VATNAKLQARALRLVSSIAEVDAARARGLLTDAAGSVKVAIAMHRRGVDAAEARALLAEAGGFLRPVIKPEAR